MSGRRIRARTAAIAVVALGLAACGSDDPGVTPRAAATLHGGVQIVRAAAASGDRDAAAAATDHVEATLAALRADGRVSDDANHRIRRAIARVRSDLALIPTTTTTTTTTTTPPDEHGKEHGKGHAKLSEHDD